MFLGKGSSAQGRRPVYQAQSRYSRWRSARAVRRGSTFSGVVLVFLILPQTPPCGPPVLRLIAVDRAQALCPSPALRAYFPAAVAWPGCSSRCLVRSGTCAGGHRKPPLPCSFSLGFSATCSEGSMVAGGMQATPTSTEHDLGGVSPRPVTAPQVCLLQSVLQLEAHSTQPGQTGSCRFLTCSRGRSVSFHG